MGMAKFCSNCGAARAEGTKFCKDCGQLLLPANLTPLEDKEELIAPTQTGGAVEETTVHVVAAKTKIALEETTDHAVDVETEIVLGETTAHVVDVETEIVLEETTAHVVAAKTSAPELMILTESAASAETPALSEQKQPLGGLNQRLEGIVNKRTRRPLIYASALIGVVLLSVVAWSIFGSTSSKSSPLVYVKGFELMLMTNKQDKPIEATRNWLDADKEELTDALDLSSDEETTLQGTSFYQMGESAQQWIKLNASGNRMFYLNKISDDGTANLYYSNPTKVAKAGDNSTDQGVRIASNLSIGQYRTFQISASGDYVIYLKNYEDTTGGSLYLYNMKEEILIDNNVSDGYSLSEDDSSIIYMKTPDDETYDLYTKSVESKSEKVKIDSDINNIVNYSSDLKTIYYTKSNDVDDDESENLNINSLYVKQAGKDKQKLISDYHSLESNSSTGQFYFTRTTMNSSNLIDWVEDDMAAEDLKITEPSYSDFEHETTNTDYWGDTYTTDEVDYDQYYAAMDLYDDKLQRDSLRSDLKNEELSTTNQKLFLYAEGKETEISNEFGHITYADAASKSIIYVKSVDGKVEKVKLSEISSTYDVQDLFENNTSESKGSYIVLKGAPEQEMPEDAKDSNNFTFSDDGKKIYYTEGDADSSTGTLVVWDLLEGKLSNRKVIDENVDQYMMVNDDLLYYKDVKDDQGELLTYSDGKKVKIAYDVQLGYTTFYPNDDVLLYMTEFNDKRLMGSLFMKRGEKSVKISDDVNFYNYNKGTHLFYLSEYRLKNGEGDLWEYLGSNDKKLIDSGVQAMLPIRYGLTF
ncbi:DNA-directed RNA polymerase subunit M/transcription elongation factor TFIIS [Paenibacillus sp. DS2015]|uniref:zinc ribbon domain-containing protein n=1 Tax=Paenibacillus sp. DS2015 TaxID=3373917 RepID=UPI003D1A0E78